MCGCTSGNLKPKNRLPKNGKRNATVSKSEIKFEMSIQKLITIEKMLENKINKYKN